MSSEVSTELEQDATKRMFERLMAAKDKSKDNDEIVIKDLEGARMFQDAFCCSDPIYQDQIKIILPNEPDNIGANTVASYLYGCFQDESTVEIACTPECSTGLKNPNLAPCDIASYQKSDKLIKVNSVVSEDADVFISQGSSLTKDDMAILRSQGIKVITTYNQNGNTITYTLGQSLTVEQDPAAPTQTSDNSTTTSSGWVWVWIIIAILLIAILAVIFLRQ